MLKIAFAVVFCFFAIIATGQTSMYKSDAETLYNLLKSTPSYKDQIRGAKEKAYDSLYQTVRNDTLNISGSFDYYFRLLRLFFPIRDNHLGFYQIPVTAIAEKDYNNEKLVGLYRQHPSLKNYPRVNLNIDSLRNELTKKPKDSIEGLYFFGTIFEVGLFRSNKNGEYTGSIIHSTVPQWQKGEISIRLFEYEPGFFKAVYADPLFKNLLLYSNEKFVNHSLINSHFYSLNGELFYKKDTLTHDFSRIPQTQTIFEFKKLIPEIQYLRLGSFQANSENEKLSIDFYNKIKDSLVSPNLIVDLRDNNGGAFKISYRFFTLIRQFARDRKVFVLINNGTMSQGEIFTLQLSALANVTVLGQTSRGTIAYGSNEGKTGKLAGGSIEVYLTDMRDTGNYFKYESYGVTPAVILNPQKDWIEQTIQYINIPPAKAVGN